MKCINEKVQLSFWIEFLFTNFSLLHNRWTKNCKRYWNYTNVSLNFFLNCLTSMSHGFHVKTWSNSKDKLNEHRTCKKSFRVFNLKAFTKIMSVTVFQSNTKERKIIFNHTWWHRCGWLMWCRRLGDETYIKLHRFL